jgi:ribose transport system ATP-binding protein
MTRPLLELRQISKRFPGVQALNKVDLKLHEGEILAVIGENGAGKSTLMKILGGIIRPDRGEIRIQGQIVQIESVNAATGLGIALIHQELNLSDNLDIASNVFLGREPSGLGALKLVDSKRIYQDTENLLNRLGLYCSAKTLVSDLSIGYQQMVEIAKALSVSARILIMDEPTSSLSQYETEQLFKVMRELKSQGVSIIYVSHRLGEVKTIADRVSVLRDGCNSGELLDAEIEHDQMARLMVGRSISQFYLRSRHVTRTPILEVQDLRLSMERPDPINFTLYSGEMLVLAGLVGSGRSDVLHALFGIRRPMSGKILLDGQPITIRNPRDAIRAGIGLVPEDRRLEGLILEMTVEENVTMANLNAYQRMRLIQFDQTRSITEKTVTEFDIHTPTIDQEMGLLSGGNQQKVVLAKWILLKPKVLLLDEPTRGVDIVAKEEIYRLIDRLLAEGVGILMASSEMQEVLGIADRILPMLEGRLNGELMQDQFSEEALVNLITGVKR